MDSNIYFIYNQKLVIFSKDKKRVLLAKRQGEADYNHTFTFVGGKMETTDASIVAAMKREKDEEIGSNVKIGILDQEKYTVLFRKKDDDSMIVTHTPCLHVSGEVELSDEYSEYQWVDIDKLDKFKPMVPNIPEISRWALGKLNTSEYELTEI